MALDLDSVINETLSEDDYNKLNEQIRNVVIGIAECRKVTNREMSAAMQYVK